MAAQVVPIGRDTATREQPDGPARPWLLPLTLLSGLLLALAAMSVRPAQPGRHVAAVFPPWWSLARSAEAVAAADGTIVGVGAWRSLIVVAASGPAAAARLRGAGAWLLFDAASFVGCPDLPSQAS